ncbi:MULTISPECIES: DUF4181 domain-containing protein [Planomicrobium]|uniref:DUF4181 domain-containing protein n=1 Tax=Planomicrobium TaxID=162291 RepID=UPI0009FDC25A|nr:MULTISPECIES: DUF4181 domain-containing protein [Planomicrobium]PKH12041.1 DUF4181 domain-containing protein [Planomicrobium sp. MB-3u-38]
MFDDHPDYSRTWLPLDFEWKFVLFLLGMVAILFLVNLFLKKVLGVEKRNIFKANYVNARHEKVEFYLNIAGTVGMVAALIYGYEHGALYPIYASVVAALIVTLYKAYMERKYAENPREYIFTLLEFPLIILLILSFAGFMFPDIPLF